MNNAPGAHPNAPQGLQQLLGNAQLGIEPDALRRHLLAVQQQQAAQQFFLNLQQHAEQRRHSILASAAAAAAAAEGAVGGARVSTGAVQQAQQPAQQAAQEQSQQRQRTRAAREQEAEEERPRPLPRGVNAVIARMAPIGSEQYPETEWSITVSLRTRDVPGSWLNRLSEMARQPAPAAADGASSSAHAARTKFSQAFFALEVGGRHKRLHIQGCVRCRAPRPVPGRAEDGGKRLQYEIKEFIPIPAGDNASVTVKLFAENQTWEAMLGYCQKDSGTGHYRYVAVGISPDELSAACDAYSSVSLTFNQGRTEISKASLARLMFQFWFCTSSPLFCPQMN